MWFLFSLSNALAESLKDAFGKFGAKKFDEYLAAWGQRFFALILLIPAALLWGSRVMPDGIFWLATLGSVTINTATSILYMRALKESPLSLTTPVVALSPVFLLFTSPLINREHPSLLGITGVLISVCGVYFLNYSKRQGKILAPFNEIWRERGMRLMLFVAFLWSVSAPLDKVAVTHSDPFIYTAISNALLAIALFPFVITRMRIANIFRSGGNKNLFAIGVFSGLSIIFQMIAFSMTLVPYAIGVKRTSALFGVFWGKLFFSETNLKERLSGALIILSGAILILLATF